MEIVFSINSKKCPESEWDMNEVGKASHLNWQPHADSTYSELLKQFSSDIGIMCLT